VRENDHFLYCQPSLACTVWVRTHGADDPAGLRQSYERSQDYREAASAWCAWWPTGDQVRYSIIQTGKEVAIRTLPRYGRIMEEDITRTRDRRSVPNPRIAYRAILIANHAVWCQNYWPSIAGVRSKLQRVSVDNLIFVDQSSLKVDPGTTQALAPSGERP
jgi:hypothetical protein